MIAQMAQKYQKYHYILAFERPQITKKIDLVKKSLKLMFFKAFPIFSYIGASFGPKSPFFKAVSVFPYSSTNCDGNRYFLRRFLLFPIEVRVLSKIAIFQGVF